MNLGWQLLISWIGLTSLLGFLIMGYDKRQARRQAWRISEKTLWLFTLLGGSLGIWLGMSLFRHKTQKTAFKYGVPLLWVLQWGCLLYGWIKI